MKQRKCAFPEDGWTLLEKLASIGAPTRQEEKRADFIEQWLIQHGAGCLRRDECDNVIIDFSDGKSPVWLLDAHTDIVFDDTELRVVKEGNLWKCPGIYDNTVNCVLLLLLARELLAQKREFPLLISFSAGEEGEGDLFGIREIARYYRDRLRAGWALDLGLESVTIAAVGSRRWQLSWLGSGGHSWGDFGAASAVHVLSDWVASLKHSARWQKDKLSYNIGRISGGTTINAVAERADCWVDLRSVDPKLLDQTAEMMLHQAEKLAREAGVKLEVKEIGFRPAGKVPQNPPLLAMIEAIHTEMQLETRYRINSTNANALLAAGIPASCTGLCIGGQVHTRDEWLDASSLPLGWQKLWLLLEHMMRAEGVRLHQP